MPNVARRQPPIVVVPSCVDLDRFPPPTGRSSQTLTLVYVGSLGGRYIVRSRSARSSRSSSSWSRMHPCGVLTFGSRPDDRRARAPRRCRSDSWAVRHAQTEESRGFSRIATWGCSSTARDRARRAAPRPRSVSTGRRVCRSCAPRASETSTLSFATRSVGVVLPDLGDDALAPRGGGWLRLVQDPGSRLGVGRLRPITTRWPHVWTTALPLPPSRIGPVGVELAGGVPARRK